MAYTRKTRDFWAVQQYTGRPHGWEDVSAAATYMEACETWKDYRANQPAYPVRIKLRREKIDQG